MEKLTSVWKRVPGAVRKPVVAIAGGLVILAGIAMLALPGPGWLTIFAGLMILQTEFTWAARLRSWLMTKFKSAYEAIKTKRKS